MRVVIIEDEPLAASRLKMIFSEYDPSIEIVAVLESVEDAVQYFQQHVHPDLVMLDIELADGISFSIFSRVKVYCPVIFVTAYDKYALDAFRLFSIDYLLKPVTQEALSRALLKYLPVFRLLHSKYHRLFVRCSSLEKPTGKNFSLNPAAGCFLLKHLRLLTFFLRVKPYL
jgi:two-component SAPR family response regulator